MSVGSAHEHRSSLRYPTPTFEVHGPSPLKDVAEMSYKLLRQFCPVFWSDLHLELDSDCARSRWKPPETSRCSSALTDLLSAMRPSRLGMCVKSLSLLFQRYFSTENFCGKFVKLNFPPLQSVCFKKPDPPPY